MESPALQPGTPLLPRKKMTKQLIGKRDDTLLHAAARVGNLDAAMEIFTGNVEDQLKELLEKQNESGETPLYVAAEYGYVDMVREMIKHCDLVDAGIKAKNGFDAFHIAAKQGDLGMCVSVVEFFIGGRYVESTKQWKITAEILRVLMEAHPEVAMTVDSSNTTALHTAATQGHIEIVNFLLETGSSLATIARSNGKTALHSALEMGIWRLLKLF